MLIPELSRLFDPVPRAIDHAYPVLLDVLEVVFGNEFFAESTQDYSLELLLLILYFSEEVEALHLLSRALLTIAVFEINHEERHLFLRLNYLFPPMAFLLLLPFYLTLLLIPF